MCTSNCLLLQLEKVHHKRLVPSVVRGPSSVLDRSVEYVRFTVLRGSTSVFGSNVKYVWFPLFYEVRVLYLTKMSNTFGSLCRKRLVFCSWLKFSVIIWTFNEFRRDVIFEN